MQTSLQTTHNIIDIWKETSRSCLQYRKRCAYNSQLLLQCDWYFLQHFLFFKRKYSIAYYLMDPHQDLGLRGLAAAGFPIHEVNDAQIYLQTKGLDIRLCAQKVNALQMILTEKREEWADGAVGYAKNMCEELGISINPRRRITRKNIFDDGTRDDDKLVL